MRTTGNPSPRHGWATVLASPRLVLAVWIVPFLLTAPFILTVQALFEPVLGNLPGDAAPGDLQLIVTGILGRSGAALAVPLLGAVLGGWAWRVLWHAGLVRWRIWGAGRSQRLGEVLGLGVMGWWRWARLAVLAALTVAVVMGDLWGGAIHLAKNAVDRLDETASVRIVLVAAGLSAIVLLLLWAATLRALWELGRPGRRSAAAAWLRGLWGAVRHPLASVGTLLVWAVPGLAAWGGGLAAVRVLGPGLAGMAALQLGALLTAVCAVGLAGAFAPVAAAPPLEARSGRRGSGDGGRATAGGESGETA